MIRRSTLGLLLFLILGIFQAQAQWEQVRYHGQMYVTVNSFCDFYSFKHVGSEGDKTLLFAGPYGTLKLTDDGREAYINGRKVWLALNLTMDDAGRRLISYVDVVKMMEPVLRPNKVKRLRPIKGVVIDAGHGGSDNGARGRYGLMEKDMTLDTAQRLEKILRASGIPTVLTRRTDVFVPLEQRAAIAAQYPNYLFVSIHYNQGQSQASGIETFALTPQYAPSTDSAGVMRVSDATRENGNRNDEANILLADFIHQEVRKLHPPEGDRGVKRARFVVLRLNALPSTLVEGGFLSNPGDARMIGSTTYRDKLAGGIAKGIRRFIALSKGDAGTDATDVDVDETPKEPARPLPEPPRPLDSKPTGPVKPVEPAKPTPAETAPAKPGKPAPTPAPAPAPGPDKPVDTTAKPGESTGKTPAKPTEKTPAKPEEKKPSKPGAAPEKPKSSDKDKPKPDDKSSTKPGGKTAGKPSEPAPNVPQLKAAEPQVAPVLPPEPAPKPASVPVIETAPPPVKRPSGPMIETSPAPKGPAINTTPEPAEP